MDGSVRTWHRSIDRVRGRLSALAESPSGVSHWLLLHPDRGCGLTEFGAFYGSPEGGHREHMPPSFPLNQVSTFQTLGTGYAAPNTDDSTRTPLWWVTWYFGPADWLNPVIDVSAEAGLLLAEWLPERICPVQDIAKRSVGLYRRAFPFGAGGGREWRFENAQRFMMAVHEIGWQSVPGSGLQIPCRTWRDGQPEQPFWAFAGLTQYRDMAGKLPTGMKGTDAELRVPKRLVSRIDTDLVGRCLAAIDLILQAAESPNASAGEVSLPAKHGNQPPLQSSCEASKSVASKTPKDLITKRKACEICDISETTLNRRIRDGVVQAYGKSLSRAEVQAKQLELSSRRSLSKSRKARAQNRH